MWRTIGRIALVSLVWAVTSALAARMGVSAGWAQLLCGISAGLSLIAWGLAVHRVETQREATPAAPPAVLPGRRSATV